MDKTLVREILAGYLLTHGPGEHPVHVFDSSPWYDQYNGCVGKKGGLLTYLSLHGFTAARVEVGLSYWQLTDKGLAFIRGDEDEQN